MKWLWFGGNAVKDDTNSLYDSTAVRTSDMCFVFILFAVSNILNMLYNTSFTAVLPAIDLIDVLNDESLPTSYVHKGVNETFDNDLLLSKLEGIYKANEEEYLKNINSMILMIHPIVKMSSNQLIIDLEEGRYYYYSGLIEYPDSGVDTVFKQKYHKAGQFFGLRNNKTESLNFTRRYIYPLYHSSNYSEKKFNLGRLINLVMFPRFSNLFILISCILLIVEVLIALVIEQYYKNEYINEDRYKITLGIFLPISVWVNTIIYVILLAFLSINVVTITMIVSYYPIVHGFTICFFTYVELIAAGFVVYYNVSWFKKLNETRIAYNNISNMEAAQDNAVKIQDGGDEDRNDNEDPSRNDTADDDGRKSSSPALSIEPRISRTVTPESVYSSRRAKSRLRTAPADYNDHNTYRVSSKYAIIKAVSAPYPSQYLDVMADPGLQEPERCTSRFTEDL